MVSRTAPFMHRRATLAKTSNLLSLKLSLRVAQKRVDDAKTIGWAALEQSWQADLDLIEARIGALFLEAYRKRKGKPRIEPASLDFKNDATTQPCAIAQHEVA